MRLHCFENILSGFVKHAKTRIRPVATWSQGSMGLEHHPGG